jgi:hypothetical protein
MRHQLIRYQCRDCAAPIVPSSPRRKNQPATGHCDCPDTAWLLPWRVAPVKVVARGGLVDVFEERATVVRTETVPPLAVRR